MLFGGDGRFQMGRMGDPRAVASRHGSGAASTDPRGRDPSSVRSRDREVQQRRSVSALARGANDAAGDETARISERITEL